MAVDPAKAFSRESWNEDIIREVNLLCVNPDVGCDPLPLLDEAEPDHIWAKSDVTEVQDKLKEICPENEFEEMETPQLWHYDGIIVPIEEAIRLGWCNCATSDTEYDFGYFPQRNLEAGKGAHKSNPTVDVNGAGCGGFETITYLSPYYPVPLDNEILQNIIIETYGLPRSSPLSYTSLASIVFYYEDVVEDLEDEISILEGQIVTIEDDIEAKEVEITEAIILRDYYCIEEPGGSNCTDYTALVTALEGELADLEDDLQVKEGELEVKETELDAAQNRLDELIEERDTSRQEWDAKAQIIWAARQSMSLQYSTDIQPIRDLFPEMHEPWGDHFEDTRRKKPGQWYFYIDRHDNGIASLVSGSFSPGGYPEYSGPSGSLLVRLENTCRFYEYTYHKDCICPWEIPFQGTEDCEGQRRIWWKFTGLLDIDCANVEADDWRLTFRIKHSPDYTRPPPE